MLSDLKKLSKGLIIYSVLVSDFEKLDFKNDALAGVRANYFNSNKQPQQDNTDISFDDKKYKISYSMVDGVALSWKVSRNHMPFQSVRKISDTMYCVIFYGENGVVNKRIYFDNNHNWIRTEYYDGNYDGVKVGVLSPKHISGVFTIVFERISHDGTRFSSVLYPSKTPPRKKCKGLVYTNIGMLWYDQIFAPKDVDSIFSTDSVKIISGFEFFDDEEKLLGNQLIDFSKTDYLTDEKDTDVKMLSDDEDDQNDKENTYSAYDKIENILFEAHKTNKDLFGEIITQTAGYSEKNADDTDETVDLKSSEEPISDTDSSEKVSVDVKADGKSVTCENEISLESLNNTKNTVNTQTNSACETKNETEETNVDLSSSANIGFTEDDETEELSDKAGGYEHKDIPPCNVVIHTDSGKYTYYGSVDKNNNRIGIGRTVTPQGLTSYEGGYSEDKRSGFGVCYYKEGNINYVGNWIDGRRSGRGVGYRLSDGTMHAGKWDDNLPVGFGARFDENGEFIDIAFYSNGVRNGKSVSFDENGRVLIQKWSDGKLVSEFTVDEEE